MNNDPFKYGASFDPMEARRLLQKLEEAGVEFQIDVDAAAGGGFLSANQSVAIYLHRDQWEKGMELLGLPPVPEDMVDGLPWESEAPEADETPVESGMTLDRADGGMIQNPTAGDILRALQEMSPEGGDLVVLRQDAEHFLHASGGLGVGHDLGYQDGRPAAFFRSVRGDLSLAEAHRLFVAYLRREPNWQAHLDWEVQG